VSIVIARSEWWDRLPACLLRMTGKMPAPLAISSGGTCEIATGCRPRNDMPGNLCSPA
jgi:hypothetical protein